MEFFRLMLVIFVIGLLSYSCDHDKNEIFLIVKYRGHNINDRSFNDSMYIKYIFNEQILDLIVEYKDTTKAIQIKSDVDGIYCLSVKDEFEKFVEFKYRGVKVNSCHTAYPIIGSYSGWLGSKYFPINQDSFIVRKYFIEREENPFISGVAVYFLDDFGFLIFHFEEGNYLMPYEVIGNTNIPWKRLIAEVKKDTSFSELQPIPPTPPTPNPTN